MKYRIDPKISFPTKVPRASHMLCKIGTERVRLSFRYMDRIDLKVQKSATINITISIFDNFLTVPPQISNIVLHQLLSKLMCDFE